MTPLAGNAVRAAMYPAMHHDPTATAGTQDHAEHHAESGAGTVGGLTEGKAVGVVFDPHLAAERL